MDVVDTGTTAFMLCCIIGLTLMIPGLALFYGGMVSVKSSTNMMMMTFGAVAIVGVLWVLFGFSMVFGTSYDGFVGSFTEFLGMKDLLESQTTISGLPVSLFSLFQALFAAITVALISGAVADRMKFGAWMLFATVWAVLVYFPVAHWVFAFDGVVTEDSIGGWIANSLKAIDFAGGTAVHINAGAAALAVAIVLGKSAMFGQLRKPHNVPLTLLGAGLLWAGWYAFNGGSALAAGNSAAIVMVTTFVATCAATLAWLAVEKFKDGHVTGVGAASGAITGLVAITPACGAVTPVGAIAVGAIAGADLRVRRRPEVEVRLRRLARRRRRPPRRRCHRHPADRLVRQREHAQRNERPVLRRRRRPTVEAGGRRVRRDGVLVRGRLRHRLRDQEDDRHPHLPRRRGEGHRLGVPSRIVVRARRHLTLAQPAAAGARAAAAGSSAGCFTS